MFAIEYYNPWRALVPRFVPEQEILPGDETDRLHRWGYARYRDLFNERQLLGLAATRLLLALSCQRIMAVGDERVRHALATNLSDLLRYQNMLCRYDTMAVATNNSERSEKSRVLGRVVSLACSSSCVPSSPFLPADSAVGRF
jgi:hypothetical protein